MVRDFMYDGIGRLSVSRWVRVEAVEPERDFYTYPIGHAIDSDYGIRAPQRGPYVLGKRQF